MNTVLVEIGNTLNSRPLTYLSEENYQSSITPHHLLFSRNINQKYSSTTIDPPLQGNDLHIRVKHLCTILGHYCTKRKTFLR